MTPEQKLFWDNRPPAAMAALHAVMEERHRQMMVEGWTAKHDDEHDDGAMALAAAAYAIRGSKESHGALQKLAFDVWRWTGWASQWWKPKDRRRNLVRAAALLLAEIERMDRAVLARCTDGVMASDADRVQRLRDAIEGECDGLAIDEEHARAILAYVDGMGGDRG